MAGISTISHATGGIIWGMEFSLGKVMATLASVVALMGGALLLYDRLQEARTNPEVRITSPENTDVLPRRITVTGTAAHIPSDRDLWLVVKSPSQARYYPLDLIEAEDYESWVGQVTIGSKAPGESGHEFMIMAMLTDSGATERFRNFLENIEDKQYRGIPLPEGAVEVARVDVTRK
jgi:hypothetical protein